MKGDIDTTGHQLTSVAFKKDTQFTKYIAKIDQTTIHAAEDLDLVMQ